MNKIAILGAGQLGNRHLQGLSKLSGDNYIYVIDPSGDSLSLSETGLNEVIDRNPQNKYSFNKNYDSLPNQIDLTIISTTADVRRMAFENLIKSTKTRKIIFEKFLFQMEADYRFVSDELSRRNIEAWVNCPRRVYPEFVQLKTFLHKKKIREINIEGNNWALAGNSIHLIDLMAYLIECREYNITVNNLFYKAFSNKREGFIEFEGKFSGVFANGTAFNIACYNAVQPTVIIEIILEDGRIIIDQIQKQIIQHTLMDSGWNTETTAFPNYLQSELTGIIVDQILNKNYCLLTGFEESVDIHLPLFRLFLDHYRNIMQNEGLNICPIT